MKINVLHVSLFVLFVFFVGAISDSQIPSSTELDALKKQVTLLTKAVDDLQDKVATLQSAVQVTTTSVVIKSSSIEIASTANLKLKGASVSVDGGTLKLNGGGPGVARRGDQVACPNGMGTITGGSTTVLAD